MALKRPMHFGKVIIRNDRAISFVTIQELELELVTGESIPVEDYLKHEKPEYSWVIPRGCNKG
jgi:hypothetical protein